MKITDHFRKISVTFPEKFDPNVTTPKIHAKKMIDKYKLNENIKRVVVLDLRGRKFEYPVNQL